MNTLLDNASDSDRAAALLWLWERVIARVGQMQVPATGRLYEVGADDAAMCEASADDCFGWMDDCEARLGCDVAEARAAMLDFILARDGLAAADAPPDALCAVLSEARGRLHSFHPVLRGLQALVDAGTAPPDND